MNNNLMDKKEHCIAIKVQGLLLQIKPLRNPQSALTEIKHSQSKPFCMIPLTQILKDIYG